MMFLETSHQKKSAIITFLVMVFVVFLMFFCGLTQLEVPEEFGVAINFGTSDFGSGSPKLNQTIKSDLVKNIETESVKPVEDSSSELVDDVLTQNVAEAPVLEKKKIKKVEIEKPKKVSTEKILKKESVKELPKPAKATQNVLSNLFGKKSDGASSESEGDDNVQGVKGKLDGLSDASKYYGNNGSGGNGNYLLKGRKALSKPKRKPECNEEGVVVVRIEVDNRGNVVKAVPGVKGTTNNSPCLLNPAKKAALSTKWNADGNAPLKQVGLIRYKFILSE